MPKPDRPSGPKLKAEFTIEDRYFNKRQDPKVQQEWVDALTAHADRMNNWEKEYVGRMAYKLNNQYRLTENEALRLEQIYADRTPN